MNHSTWWTFEDKPMWKNKPSSGVYVVPTENRVRFLADDDNSIASEHTNIDDLGEEVNPPEIVFKSVDEVN